MREMPSIQDAVFRQFFQLNKDAKILIIGQAPGRKVEESKIPFDDKSGRKADLLDGYR